MIAAAQMVTGLALSCAALIGLAILHSVLMARDRWDPLNRRFLFGIRVTMVLFAGRALLVLTGVSLFGVVTLVAAGIIPLAVLILCEGLLRRHAPLWAKAVIGGGTITFVLLGFFPSGLVDPARSMGLLIFQLIGFCTVGWLILTRDQASLSWAENTTIVRLGLSLFGLIPVIIADFLIDMTGLPVQVSALGVLVLCWLAVGLGRVQTGHDGVTVSFVVMVVASVAVAGLLGLLVGLDRDGEIIAFTLIFAATLLVAMFNDGRSLKNEEKSLTLLRHMAQAQVDDPVKFLRALNDHPYVEGAVVIEGDSLIDLEPVVLKQIFDIAPVLRYRDPPMADAAAADHVAHLFDRYAATHIILAAEVPFVLIALNLPSLSTSPQGELELQAVQRMAALIARQKDA